MDIKARFQVHSSSRFVRDGSIIRIYDGGQIVLFVSEVLGKTLNKGAVPSVLPDTDSLDTCLLCDQPALHWGVFLTPEEAIEFSEKSRLPSSAALFGLCGEHDPGANEEDICDAVYELMLNRSDLLIDLRKAQTVIETWLEELQKGGRNEKDSIEIILSMLDAGKLTEGGDFPKHVKAAMRILLLEELSNAL